MDYENCKFRKNLVDKLIGECTKTIEEVKLANITIVENENDVYCIHKSSFYNFYRNYYLFCSLQLVFD